jgi:hypothetical protein
MHIDYLENNLVTLLFATNPQFSQLAGAYSHDQFMGKQRDEEQRGLF